MNTRSTPLSEAGHTLIVAPRIVVPSPKNDLFKAPTCTLLTGMLASMSMRTEERRSSGIRGMDRI